LIRVVQDRFDTPLYFRRTIPLLAPASFGNNGRLERLGDSAVSPRLALLRALQKPGDRLRLPGFFLETSDTAGGDVKIRPTVRFGVPEPFCGPLEGLRQPPPDWPK
jgi:hypothetical protein